MDHAITIGNVLIVGGTVLGLVLLVGGLFLVLDILNPFRSGH